VGLTGEVRGISQPDARVRESVKLGFEQCILPKANLGRIEKSGSIQLRGVESLQEVMKLLF